MAFTGHHGGPIAFATLIAIFVAGANAIDIFLEWNVALDYTIQPVSVYQPVITINGKFPGPLINTTTNDFVHVNVFNNMDHESLLFTWNGIQQRLNSWQDGVSGTNCPILPSTNWTYVFQTKDQIGSFFYFPSINFHKAAGGFGPICVNNRNVIAVPFPKLEAEFDLLIGDWSYDSYKMDKLLLVDKQAAIYSIPDITLMNGKCPFGHPMDCLSYNFRIQGHQMVVVETEGSYTNQITVDTLDVHVGQSYSVLVTADQIEADYYIVASPKLQPSSDSSSLVGVGVLHYSNSNTQVSGPLPIGPDPFNLSFSVIQAKSIRWNMTAGAARPNPQGTFNVTNVTLSQTFILQNSVAEIQGLPRYVVKNVSYYTQDTPLKLADYKGNGSGVYDLDQFPVKSVNAEAAFGVSVVTGNHKGWIELVFKNNLGFMDSWHLDVFGFYVVG
ncbi:monocopper oxidase-like protein SKU5 [Fagus crenata]